MTLKDKVNRFLNHGREQGQGELCKELTEVTNLYENAVLKKDFEVAGALAQAFWEKLEVLEKGLGDESRISHGVHKDNPQELHQLIVGFGDALCALRQR